MTVSTRTLRYLVEVVEDYVRTLPAGEPMTQVAQHEAARAVGELAYWLEQYEQAGGVPAQTHPAQEASS